MVAQIVNFSMNIDDVFNPVYVAVATGVATCQSNTDPRGGTWTSRTMPVSSAWQSVDYGNGMIVAVSSTSGQIAATSVDGTTWVQRTLPTSTTWYAVKYGDLATNDKWVAVSSAGNYAATSPDGCTWTARSIAGTTYAWKSLSYGNGVWVALANTTTDDTLITAVSSDGITWTNQTATNITCPGDWSSITFGGGKFVAVCSGSTVAAYSTDGINWTASVLPANTAWVSVCYGDGVYIAVTATNSDKAARSENGTSWSEITFPAASTWRAVIYGKNIVGEGIFAGVGATTVGNYSLDAGVTWNAKTQVTMTYTAACYAPIRWYSADTLTLNNGAVLTVNTDQHRFWATMSLANGLLDIRNTTSSGITFSMGRSSGATAGTITPSTGLGRISISGSWMDIGVGSGQDDQVITVPYTDYVPALWVETASGTGSYKQWVNVTGAYGDNNPVMWNGLSTVGSGTRGEFFVQDANDGPYGPIGCTTSGLVFVNQRATRYLKLGTTLSGVIPGAQVFGAGITAATVVNRVLSSNEIELSLPTSNLVRTDWTGVAYGTPGGIGTYVAISKNYSDKAAYSTNAGVTWTPCTLPFKADWKGICWGGTSARFVAVCHGSNLCATSSDGITWTTQNLITSQNWKAVASNGTSFVAVGAVTADTATTVGAYSADGLTWTATVMSSAIWQAVCWGTNRYVAVSSTFTSNWDADGAGTWTAGGTLTAGNFVGIAHNGTRFVAISGSSTVTRYSTDATSWSTGGVLPNSLFKAICWTGTTFIAVSTSTTAAQTAVTSADGAAWTNRTLGVNDWTAVCFGAVSVAVAGANATTFGGSTASTSDATGVTWTNQPSMVSDVALSFFNPYRSQLKNQVRFGNDVNGCRVPIGAKIRCPNVLVTSLAPANLHTASNALGCSIVSSNGGPVSINTALFDECYHNFTQAQSVAITDAAFSIPFLISECYAFNLTRVAFALQPVRRYYTTNWFSRELRYGQTAAWSYINNAVLTDLTVCTAAPHAQYGTTTATSPITFSYIDAATFTRLKYYVTNPIKANHIGFLASTMLTNCTVTDSVFYGCAPYQITTSSNNTFTNATVAPRLFSGKTGHATSGSRIGIDPATGEALVSGTRYYFKVRSYRDSTDMTRYVEGPLVSATPFVGSKWFSPRFSAVNTASSTVTFNWDRRDPSSSSVACYEIFRGTSPGFVRNLAARVYTIATPATITTTDATVSNGNTYYYVMRKYDGSLAGITNSTGSIGTYTLGTAQSFLTGLGTIANCQGTAGTRKVYIPSGSASNFLAGNVWAGMPISHASIPAGTTVVSVDNELEITISNDISSSFVSQALSLGAMAGLYVSGTGIVAGTRVVSVDSATSITVDTAFSGAVSGTITFLYGTEGPEVEVFVAGAKQTASNLLFQSYDFTNATWVKTNLTATAAIFYGPPEPAFNAASAPTALGVRLVSIGPSANMVNTQAGLASATSYTFSLYGMTPPTLQLNNVVSCTVAINTTSPTTHTFDVTGEWSRIEVPFTSTATTHTFTVTINNNGATVYLTGAQINTGSTATVPVATTTAAVTLNPVVQEITAAYAWGRSTGGTNMPQGIELVLATAPAGTHFTNVYMSTDPAFVPSTRNLVDTTIATTVSMVNMTTSSNNVVETIIQEEKGQAGTLITLAGTSASVFKNIDYDFGYGVSALFNISALANNNLFHNFHISKFRNFIATSPLTTLNNASGNLIQNCYFDTFDLPLLVNNLNTELRGISGGNATPAGSATTWVLGGTSDGVGVAYTTVYDMNFYELYHSPTTGALNLCFNDSTKAIKPYENVVGSPAFSNTGRLYLQNHGDSITFVWPHMIKGVTSFRNLTPKLNGLDLGTAVDTLFGVLVEFAISNDGGDTYSAFQEMTGPTLAATSITSATAGFGLKVRVTCRKGMKYTAQSNAFIIDEQIKGATSLATAYVRKDNDLGTTGDILIDTVVGEFIAGEAIVRQSDSQARATNLATNTNFALFPSFSSYIDGVQIYTNVDPTIHYPLTIDPMTITIVNSSLVPVEGAMVRVTASETAGGYTVGDTLLMGTTDVLGVITGDIPSTASVGVLIRTRKSSAAPYYKASDTPNTFINGTGLSTTIVLIQDA